MQANSLPSQRSSDNMTHYKTLGLLLTLYLAQGLPAGFITQALPAILREYHVSLVAIGWSGLILVPWGLKFLWATVVDGFYLDSIGRSRSWILPMQGLSIVILIAVAFFEPTNLGETQSVMTLYAMLFTLSLIGATHDVATDGLATRLLKAPMAPKEPLSHEVAVKLTDETIDYHHRQSQGNAVQVIGYRLGLIVGGGVLLMLLEKLGWTTSFLAMAGLVALNTIPIIFFQETTGNPNSNLPTITASKMAQVETVLSVKTSPKTIKQYIQYHYHYFWSTSEMRAWLGVLLTFKIADGISSGMVKPMMVDIGIGLDKIGFWVTILGSGASLIGAAAATFLMKRLTRFQALLGFNLLQALTTGLYGLIAYADSQQWLGSFFWVYLVNALEHFCASLALIAMLTTIMHYARHEQAGSDFTVQVCLLTVLGGSAHFLSGYMANALGYSWHFMVSMVVGFIFLLPIIFWYKTLNNEK